MSTMELLYILVGRIQLVLAVEIYENPRISMEHRLHLLIFGVNVNSELNKDQPFITSEVNELWFNGESRLDYPGPAIFRSIKMENWVNAKKSYLILLVNQFLMTRVKHIICS